MTIWSIVQIVLISVFVIILCGMVFEILSQKKMISFQVVRLKQFFQSQKSAPKKQIVQGHQEPKLSSFSEFSEIELVRPSVDSHALERKLSVSSDLETQIKQDLKLTEKSTRPTDFSRLLVLHIMAQQGRYFSGAALKLALQATHMHYGDLKIFHYHEFPGGVGPIFFSLASAVEPGVFDLERLEISFTPGVSLFLSTEWQAGCDFRARFEIMLKTAKQLALRLGGELFDQEHRVLTLDQILAYRQTVAEWTSDRAVSNSKTESTAKLAGNV